MNNVSAKMANKVIRKLMGISVLCSTLAVSPTLMAYQVERNDNPSGRMKVDTSWRGVNVAFNRSESKRLAHYSQLASIPAAAAGPLAAAITVFGVVVLQDAVNSGKCIRYERPWSPVSKGRVTLYTGGYCK